jgi:hypothetical protein
MSAGLTAGGDDSNYAANYVKLQDAELPIRWSAIEVLREAKYSKASVSPRILPLSPNAAHSSKRGTMC